MNESRVGVSVARLEPAADRGAWCGPAGGAREPLRAVLESEVGTRGNYRVVITGGTDRERVLVRDALPCWSDSDATPTAMRCIGLDAEWALASLRVAARKCVAINDAAGAGWVAP